MLVTDLARNAYRAARESMANGDYDLARAALRWARRADSGNPLYIHAEAELNRLTGNYHEADRLYRRIIDLAERAFGAGHVRTVALAGRMADLYDLMGREEQAATLRRRILNALDMTSAADASIQTLERIANICLQADRAVDALAIHTAALARRRAVFGEGHKRVEECLGAMKRLRLRIRMRSEHVATGEKATGLVSPIVRYNEEKMGRALPT